MEDYWKDRCLLAEDYINKSCGDPDITKESGDAYYKWLAKSRETTRS